MTITKPQDLATYQETGSLSVKILKQLVQAVKPGLCSLAIDDLAKKLCQRYQVKPAFLGVAHGKNIYQHATCISINEAVVHGIPSSNQVLVIGDVVKIDFGLAYQGLFTDLCVTVGVKKLSPADKRLVLTAQKLTQAAIPLAVSGKTTGDLGHLMHKAAKTAGFDVLKKYTGHGIGRSLHEPPTIPAYGQPQSGELLEPNTVVCLEAQVVAGSDQVYTSYDGWTVKTQDGQKSAMFEYMVVVQDKKPLILTDTLNWPIIV